MGLAEERHVVVHCWQYVSDEGHQESCDEDQADGYCVYFRFPTPYDPMQPFDTSDERDFTDRDVAFDYANQLAALKGGVHIEDMT